MTRYHYHYFDPNWEIFYTIEAPNREEARTWLDQEAPAAYELANPGPMLTRALGYEYHRI